MMMDLSANLVGFLLHDLGIPSEAMAIALQRADANLGPLHIILWQLGFISLEQLERVFCWLEMQPIPSPFPYLSSNQLCL